MKVDSCSDSSMACCLTQCYMLPLGGSASLVLCLFLVPSVVVGWVWLRSGTVLRPGQELAWGLKVGWPKGSQPGSFPAGIGGRRAASRSVSGSWLSLAKDVMWGQVVAWFYVAAVEYVVRLCGRAEAGKERLRMLLLLKPG